MPINSKHAASRDAVLLEVLVVESALLEGVLVVKGDFVVEAFWLAVETDGVVRLSGLVTVVVVGFTVVEVISVTSSLCENSRSISSSDKINDTRY